MLIDERLAAVGTANLDNRSFRLNFEITGVFDRPRIRGRDHADAGGGFRARQAGEGGGLHRQAVPVPGGVPGGAPVRADPVKKPQRIATRPRSGRWRTMLASIWRQWSNLVRLLRSSALRVNDPHWTIVSSTLRRAPQVHDFLARLVDIDRAGAGERGAVVVHHVEIGQALDAEGGARPDRTTSRRRRCGRGWCSGAGCRWRSCCRRSGDRSRVLGVGGRADDAVALAERIDRHRVLVPRLRGRERRRRWTMAAAARNFHLTANTADLAIWG